MRESSVKEIKLKKIWVEEAIKHPDTIKREGKKWFVIKKLNGITIKVVYVKEKYIKIITVFEVK